MKTHNVTHPEQTLTTETTLSPSSLGSAGGLAGSTGGAGCPASPPGNPLSWHPPLPGFEACFPKSPLELDNSSKCLTETGRNLLDQWERERAVNVGACISIFPSGEITGGFFKTGRKAPPKREGKSVSQEFTRKARKTIRRAVESGIAEFKVFTTLTFDPKIAQLNDAGQVDQAWAKKEFKRFLNTIKKFYDRRGERS